VERTLVNMADGYTRVNRGLRNGVCATQYGPGIENAFAGVAQAHADGTPILLLPLGVESRLLNVPPAFSGPLNYRGITKWADTVLAPERAPHLLRRAFHLLRSGRPGPVLLEIPQDVAVAPFPGPSRAGEGGDGDPVAAALDYRPVPRRRSMGDPADVAAAAAALRGARRPLIVAGNGVLYAGATPELIRLAEATGAAVATTILGKSAFPEDHPLAVGVMAGAASDAAVHFRREADVVFAVGASLSSGLMLAPLPPGKVLIQSTVDERDLEKTYPLDHAILGDAGLVLRQVADEVQRAAGTPGAAAPPALAATREEIGRLRAAWAARWAPQLASDEVPLSPYRVIGDLMRAVDPATAIVTHDSGQPRGELAPTYRATLPHSYLGWGNSTQLGYGLGLLMGAKLAAPQKLAVAFMGDAAFGMVGMDFETAVRARIPVLALVVNNSLMGGHPRVMPVATERYGASSLSGDYTGVARALGGYAERVAAPADVLPAIERGRKAVEDGQPALLEFVVRP
jgi:thiamine pyrophosphate-dependent acetolactate synthase large subunit-like protein